jgi:O-antigen/teichoic acid export membrane protein
MYAAAQQTIDLASSAGTAWAVIFGIIVVAVLITAFWWGGRLARRRRMPPRTPQRRAASWHRPDTSETRHSARAAKRRSQR